MRIDRVIRPKVKSNSKAPKENQSEPKASEPRDCFTYSKQVLGAAAEGTLAGGVGGLMAAGLLVSGGALLQLSGGNFDASNLGLAVTQAAQIALPPALVAGGAIGAAVTAFGASPSRTRAISTSAGAIVGAVSLGVAVHGAIKAFEAFSGL